ncbi:uncharacterized protein [Montipora capricornis]|uniref:uncharacterized protein n=1 Tax=Montipora capricornis TaxID=246305 RepID=UPI0035F1D9F5
MTAVSLEEYRRYRAEYCTRYHKEQCVECDALINMALHISQKGIVKVFDVYKSQFPEKKYQSDKAVRRLMQLPVVIFKQQHLYVTELRSDVDYKTFVDWIARTMPDEKSVKHMSKETLKSLCELASTESDRRLIQSAATWGLSGKQAKKKYGIDNNTLKINQVKEAIANAQEIHDEIIKLAQLQETALLQSMGIEDSVSDTESFEGESDLESVIESDSDENDRNSKSSVSTVHGESKAADEGQSSNHSTGNTRFNPDDLSKDVAGVVNPAPPNETLLSWLRDNSLNCKSSYQKERKRDAAKLKAANSVLKRKVTKKVSRIIKEHPTIGSDIEEFVKSKKVGADAWRRTGVLTFDGNRTRGKQVTYKAIQDHLQEKYSCKIGYGTVVQLCVVRSKRRISAKRYKGVAKVTCRKSRKGFSVKLNPDAHWSSALYKGLDSIQLKDGRNKLLLNRDDQAGFRLDTTFTHRQGKCLTLENAPSLTTRTDFMNPYSSLLQTTSYLFMKSDTTEKACAGVVKPHFNFPKNATQHIIDLEMLESRMPNYFDDKPIECIRVDGATDEGPGHLEVQFLWTERHLLKQKVCTVVSSRHSGGSYLNEVELMNGCIAKAHGNLFIPSTLAGSNFDSNGLNAKKLNENMDIATDVYIDRVDGAPCCGTILKLHTGGKNETMSERRESLLVFLKGSANDKKQLKKNRPDLYEYFERVWMVRENHMKKDLPGNYLFMLNLCYQIGCPHPLCHDETVRKDEKWFEDGPPLTYLPIPIPDPKRPWGGNCKECTHLCSGHYLRPKEHAEFVREHGLMLSKPPSIVIKEEFYDSVKRGRTLSEEKILDVAKKTLLPLEELKMHVDHLRLTAERRKEGARKAATTRKTKAASTRKKKKSNTAGGEQPKARPADTTVWCWCQDVEYGDMLLCEGDACPIKWFHFDCIGLLFSPAFSWFCPDCNGDPEQYCLCNQGEFGMMLACDNRDCPVKWFHMSCVGLEVPPKGSWICPKCMT